MHTYKRKKKKKLTKEILPIVVFLAMLSLHCCKDLSLVVVNRGYSLLRLTVVASLVVVPRL